MGNDKYVIDSKVNIRDTIKKLDQGGIGMIVVTTSTKKVVGIVTDGDFRRAILKGINLNDNVVQIINKNFISVGAQEKETIIINSFLENKIDRLLVISDGKLKGILLREDFYLQGKIILPEKKLKIPVVIMAGGKGTRMAPFTNILPKPLIPIGDRSMLEVIMDMYNLYFDSSFFISVNYKANLVKAYLEEFKDKYTFSYLDEEIPLGTAGALRLLPKKIDSSIFVSNCDIVIKDNYISIYDFHKKGENDLTIVASMQHHTVPYGVCTIKNGGELEALMEKPEYDFMVNTGMYILEPSVLELIPKNKFYHITHLIEDVQKSGGKVGVYPVTEKSWIDVGQWDEYHKGTSLLK